LADALVAIAENGVTGALNDTAIAAADVWGTLLGRTSSYDGDHEQAQQPPMTACTSGRPSKLTGCQP
jgi:hypothetical protein